MVRNLLGFSPLLFGIKKMSTKLFFRGGADDATCLSDSEFFDLIGEGICIDKEIEIDISRPEPHIPKPKAFKKRRLTNPELRKILDSNSKIKLTRNQRLLKSVIDECRLTENLSELNFQTLEEMYEFRRKYKHYLKIKRLVPLSLVAPLTGSELTKMAYAAAIGSKSVALTLPGLVGYSLPAFYFFHMSYFYVPAKLKPICSICKYTIGAPVWIISEIIDAAGAPIEERWFGEEIPLDVGQTGGTVPAELGDLNNLREVIKDYSKYIPKK